MQSNDIGSLGFDIQLTYVERLASLIGIIGYVLLVLSAGQAEQTLRERQAGVQTPLVSDLSPKTAVDSSVLRLIALVILAILAGIRLYERKQAIESGQDTNSLTPNINITLGSIVVIIGFIILTIGVVQRQQQLTPLTII